MSTVKSGKCPSCGETNEGDMQFCIFCGSSLAPREPQPQVRVEEIQPQVVSVQNFQPVAAVSVLVCTSCGRSDPLHGQYCVFCGGRTAPAPDPSANQLRHSAVHDRGLQNVSGEFPYTHVVTHPRKSATNASPVGTIVAAVLATAVGAGLGYGAMFAIKGNLETKIVEKMWAQYGDGLIVYTALPGANVMVQSHDEKSIYTGITGKTGALAINNIPAGAYQVSVQDGNRVVRKSVVVAVGKEAVVGHPEPLQ